MQCLKDLNLYMKIIIIIQVIKFNIIFFFSKKSLSDKYEALLEFYIVINNGILKKQKKHIYDTKKFYKKIDEKCAQNELKNMQLHKSNGNKLRQKEMNQSSKEINQYRTTALPYKIHKHHLPNYYGNQCDNLHDYLLEKILRQNGSPHGSHKFDPRGQK